MLPFARQQNDLRQNNQSSLYGYFVSGMPGMIMENICTPKDLTNETLGIVHTILFNVEEGTPEEIILKKISEQHNEDQDLQLLKYSFTQTTWVLN